MVRALFEGILLGLTIAFILGPAFFSILQTSIHRGFKRGLFLSIGIVLSDSFLVALSYVGVLGIFNSPKNKIVVGIIGGTILVVFGVFTAIRKYKISTEGEDIEIKAPSPFMYIIKGFFMNLLNPFLLIMWMGITGLVSSSYSHYHVLVFFSGTMATIFLTDVTKCYIANKIKNYLKPTVFLWINRIVGVTLVVFGIVLFCRVLL